MACPRIRKYPSGWIREDVSEQIQDDYLGMTLDYIVCGQLRINMNSYTEDILADFDKMELKGNGKWTSSAPNNIFVVNEECKN